MASPGPGEAEWDAMGEAERDAWRGEMTARYGTPEQAGDRVALALARTVGVPLDPALAEDGWLYAGIYRDEAAANAWMESNRARHGYQVLAKVPQADGRVVGIYDLRGPENRRRVQWHDGWCDGNDGSEPRENASPEYLEGHEEGKREGHS